MYVEGNMVGTIDELRGLLTQTTTQETDTLTGLLNCQAAQRELEQAVQRAIQEQGCLSVILLDIKDFKQINREYGRRVGDEVLRRLGHILETYFTHHSDGAQKGIPGRLGGDDFIVILPGQGADMAFSAAAEVRRLIEDSELTVTLDGLHQPGSTTVLRFRISGGIACLPGDATEAVELIRKAYEAMNLLFLSFLRPVNYSAYVVAEL
jgi:diguanylate cyclase (GGDEF)-like protein